MPTESGATHDVINQSPPLQDFDAYAADEALRAAVEAYGAGWADEALSECGRWAASADARRLSEQANRYPPVLHTHDRCGRRLDEVEFHPAYHALMDAALARRLHSLPHVDPRPGAHAARAALNHLFHNADIGVLCPVTMTFAAVPLLRRHQPGGPWAELAVSDAYDPRFVPADGKSGVTIGMAMTEKQGGSDVRANATRAAREGDGSYRLTGHKWFCSAPMSDAFLTLAQAEGGLTCFLVPRFAPDGARNEFAIQRLKDKLGNRSNASAEIEYRDTWAQRLGGEGEGVRTIMKMVQHTRLDTAVSAAAIMRRATVLAIHHARHRSVFGRRLVEQPAMRRVLADIALESEGATALALRLAHAFDRQNDEAERRFARVAVAVAKFALCKRCPALVAEALEVHGGNGYVETGPMASLYREAPLNGIWEGTGNVMALDVLRSLHREAGATEILLDEMRRAGGADRRFDAYVARLAERLARPVEEAAAREIAFALAVGLQASLLIRTRPAGVADGYVASRVAAGSTVCFGTLPVGTDETGILAGAWPDAA